MKIVSLIPSATEIIYSLGLIDNLIGVSHECDFPKRVVNLPKLTKSNIKIKQTSFDINKDIKKILTLGLSVYEVKVDLLKELNPDFIITQSQCSVCAVSYKDVKKCLYDWLKKKPKLIDLKPNNFNDVLEDINKIGIELQIEKKTKLLLEEIKNKVTTTNLKTSKLKKKSVLCIEWLDPIMIAGNWIPDLLTFSGGENLFCKSGMNSKFIKLSKIDLATLDLIIFMPCGFNIKQTENEIKNFDYFFMKLFKNKDKYIVDGNRFFNRPSPSLLDSLDILCEIIHPEVFKPKPSYERWIKL